MFNDVCGKADEVCQKKLADWVVRHVRKDRSTTEEIPVSCGSVMGRFQYHKIRDLRCVRFTQHLQ
jgi:hypothetical protein